MLQSFQKPPLANPENFARNHSQRENNPLPFIRAHIYHGIFDVAASLLGFAVLINSMYVFFSLLWRPSLTLPLRILILASAVFYYGENGGTGDANPASLFDAHALIKDIVGPGAALLFALALLAAGQSSSIIATVAGQAVSEGFLRWRVSPVVRRLITRMIGLVPSLTVAIAVGRPGIDALLVASQVVLSVTLPFITLPLLVLTSSKEVMMVRKGVDQVESEKRDVQAVVADLEGCKSQSLTRDFSNGRITKGFGMVVWLLVLVANVYVIVELGMGGGGSH